MNKAFKLMFIGLLSIAFLGLFACNSTNTTPDNSSPSKEEKSSVDSSMFSTGDTKEISESDYNLSINLSKISMDYTISKPGIYHITGDINDYQLIINYNSKNDKNLHLVLDNISMTNSKNACIYIKEGSKVVIHLIGDNTIESTYSTKVIDDNNKIDGAIFSKCDLTITGNGNLDISSSLNGIVCKDDLRFTGGNIKINSLNKAVDVNDSVRIKDSIININSDTNDGIHLENKDDTSFFYMESGELNIESALDGIDLSTSNQDFSGYFSFVGGNLNIVAGGGFNAKSKNKDSKKGIKSDNTITISGGIISINSKDDAIHSLSTLYITGGNITLKTADDCLHSDTKDVITGGVIKVDGHEGIEGKEVEISGGELNIIATDDGINASNSIIISGGYIDITLGTGDVDGVDSNGTYTQTGGIVISRVMYVDEMTSTLDTESNVNITGGTFIALGGFSNVSSKTTLNVVNIVSSSDKDNIVSFDIGNYILSDSNNDLLSFELKTKYTNLTIISDKLELNKNYEISLNGISFMTWTQSERIVSLN